MANHMSHHMDIEPDDEKTPRSSPIKSSDISTIHAGQGVHMAREKITDGLEEQNQYGFFVCSQLRCFKTVQQYNY